VSWWRALRSGGNIDDNCWHWHRPGTRAASRRLVRRCDVTWKSVKSAAVSTVAEHFPDCATRKKVAGTRLGRACPVNFCHSVYSVVIDKGVDTGDYQASHMQNEYDVTWKSGGSSRQQVIETFPDCANWNKPGNEAGTIVKIPDTFPVV